MSNPDQPKQRNVCRAPSRRRAATPARRARRPRSRDSCPERVRDCLPIFDSTCELLVAKSDDGRTKAQLSALRALLSSSAATGPCAAEQSKED